MRLKIAARLPNAVLQNQSVANLHITAGGRMAAVFRGDGSNSKAVAASAAASVFLFCSNRAVLRGAWLACNGKPARARPL
jgi:hypothetical protein